MTDVGDTNPETFQPIAVRSRSDAPVQFALRCVVDLQLLTIDRFLRPRLQVLKGRLLDAGAGEAPWRDVLSGVDYVGIDVESADQFGMRRNPAIVYYDGHTIPFPGNSFDHVLCVEVLEHVAEPLAFVKELARVLQSGGSLLLTVPWSARLHHLPHDYHRFSRYALQSMLAGSGFVDICIADRGNDVAVVANKLLIMTIRLVRSKRGIALSWRWSLALLLTPVLGLFLLAAHLTMRTDLRASEDPLGFSVIARRA